MGLWRYILSYLISGDSSKAWVCVVYRVSGTISHCISFQETFSKHRSRIYVFFVARPLNMSPCLENCESISCILGYLSTRQRPGRTTVLKNSELLSSHLSLSASLVMYWKREYPKPWTTVRMAKIELNTPRLAPLPSMKTLQTLLQRPWMRSILMVLELRLSKPSSTIRTIPPQVQQEAHERFPQRGRWSCDHHAKVPQ